MRTTVPRICIALTTGLVLGLIPVILVYRIIPRVPSVRPIERSSVLFVASSTYPIIPSVGQSAAVPPAPTSTRILFVGDIMLDRNVARRMSESHDPSYPFSHLPPHWFDQFDEAVANLEGPVTDKRRPPVKSIDFQFDPSVILTLKDQGIDAVSQANNHALDQGKEGYDDSVRRLRAAGLTVFGHQVLDDYVALATTTIRGERLAFLGFNTTDNSLDEKAATDVIAKARAEADFVVVMIHWGVEYRDRPEPAMVTRAHWFIDHGVDAVIGGHPHWVQGIQSYKGKPIVFSLGNFIFDQDFSVPTKQGLAVVLTISDGHVALEPLPIQIDASRPRIVEGEERTARLQALADISDPGLGEGIGEGRIVF